MRTVAALYVLEDGPYVGLPGIDPWPESRDARLYVGPHPVVAHPPCARWGRYWSGGPSAKVKRRLGDDGGCFAAALAAVRRWGGVLEHPEASHAWRVNGIPKPPKSGGWIRCAGWDPDAWTCCVEQGHYGHPSRKATWIYAVRTPRPELPWGPAPQGRRLEPGFHSKEERAAAMLTRTAPMSRISTREMAVTPPKFRDLLISLARRAKR